MPEFDVWCIELQDLCRHFWLDLNNERQRGVPDRYVYTYQGPYLFLELLES